MKTRIAVATLTMVSIALGWGCTTVDERLAIVAPPPPSFVAVDAGPDPEPGLTAYCPTSKCPPGRVTCPSSRFPCDVDLRTDVNNCGACGFTCPSGSNGDTFVCIEGACALKCSASPARLDCDGLADNGCETPNHNDNHCGKCGNKCTDPAKPCVFQDDSFMAVACGCPGNQTLCSGGCFDLDSDDQNCGACFAACDPTNGGDAAAHSNVYYGCAGGRCTEKCEAPFANCDGVIENGCETNIHTNENCGECGKACPSGLQCRIDARTNTVQCLCPSDLTFCPEVCDQYICKGVCVDVTSDLKNCGACGVDCRDTGGSCSYGTCVYQCPQGWADCNNSQFDGCEVNTDSDPRNCGGCGHACDAVAGQACVAGRCVVEPCSEGDAGVVAR